MCLAPALLGAVALTQLATVEITGLSRWEGGGFGMYSELPPRTRHVVIDISGSPNQLPDSAVEALTESTERFQLIPNGSKLAAVGEVLHEHSVVPFRVEAWAERFNLSTGEVSLSRIGRLSATSAPE